MTLRAYAATRCSLVLQPPRLRPKAWGPFFSCAGRIRMGLDGGGVQADGFDAHPHRTLTLELLEDAVQHAGAAPAHHARVDGVPVAVPLGQAAPFAAVGRYMQDGVEYLQVVNAHITALAWQPVLDLLKLFNGQLHAAHASDEYNALAMSVNTTWPEHCLSLPFDRLRANGVDLRANGADLRQVADQVFLMQKNLAASRRGYYGASGGLGGATRKRSVAVGSR